VIGFHDVVRVPLDDVPRSREEFIQHAGVDRRPVGGDLDRNGTEPQRAGEERSRSTRITAFADEDVDDLAALNDRTEPLKGKLYTTDVEVITDEAGVVKEYTITARDNHQFAKSNKIGIDRAGDPNPNDLHLARAAGARAFRFTPT
jgi:hypothetical protein